MMTWKKINELVLFHSQKKTLRLHDNLRRQNFHEVMRKVFEPDTKTIEDVSQDVAKTMTENSKEKNKRTIGHERQTSRNND